MEAEAQGRGTGGAAAAGRIRRAAPGIGIRRLAAGDGIRRLAPGGGFRRLAAAGALALAGAAIPAAGAELGDPERGAALWRKCASCHAVGAGAKNRVGPHLNGVFGRRAASVEGYKYSADMARAGADGLTWSPETLDLYIASPRALVTGTRMSFRGIADPGDRRDLLAFLRGYTASPADIPESAPTAAPRDPDVDPAILAIEGEPAWGEYLSSECVTCHQANGADRGIPSIVGWPAADFVIAMHAYKTEARPHPVMRMMAQRLSDEEIAGLAAFFGGL